MHWTLAYTTACTKVQAAILDFRGPIMGSLKSLCTTSYRSSIVTVALHCLVFEKIVFFAFWRQTDGQIDGQLRCVKPQSRYRALRFNNLRPTPADVDRHQECKEAAGKPEALCTMQQQQQRSYLGPQASLVVRSYTTPQLVGYQVPKKSGPHKYV